MSMEWSQIQVDQDLELVKPPIDKLQLLKYAAASGDFNLIHTDDETARKAGLPGVIVQGMLIMGFLGELLCEIAGNRAFVSRLQVRFIGTSLPGISVTCRAKVMAKDEEKRTIDFALSAELEPGKPSVVGQASLKFLL